MNFRLRIMYRAIKIRLERGESIDDIMASYPRLSEIDKEILMNELAK